MNPQGQIAGSEKTSPDVRPSARAATSTGEGYILPWLDQWRSSIQGEPWAKLFDFDGIDAFDCLLSPLYLAVLNALRKGQPKHSAAGALMAWGRDWGYAAKMKFWERAAARKSARPAPTDVLLWSRDVTHSAILQPVAAALARQGTVARLLACQPKVFYRLFAHDPTAVYTLGAWPKEVHAARAEGHRRARQLARVGRWKVPPFPQAPSSDLEEAVRASVIRYLPQVSEAIANASAAIANFRPKVLVVGNDLTMEGRTGCRVADRQGVPTALFMHGSITGDVLQARHCARRILVYGEVHRQELAQQGIDPSRVVVCGAPNLDGRPRQTGQVHPALQSLLKISPQEPWILVATSGPGHRISHQHHQLVIENLMRLCAAMPEVPIVVKLHRKDMLQYYQRALNDCAGANLHIVTHDAYGFPHEIFHWLQGCRIVLTGASTVALEAMVMDVPVITMDFCDEIHDVDFIDAGATIHVTTPEGLVQAVRQVLPTGVASTEVQANVRMHLEGAFFALDGNSSRRGAQALCEMIVPGRNEATTGADRA